jgi:very-short-patch-repair endonuclease
MKELWADPEYRERQLQGMRSPERRQKSSDGAKAQWARMSPEERREIMRKRRVVFKGGFRLTQIEATVISALNDLEAWYRVHAKVDGYIADILVQPDLVVECDGAWFHNQRPDTDEIRDQRLAGLGFRTLRLGEAEIKDGSFTVKLRESLGLAAAG